MLSPIAARSSTKLERYHGARGSVAGNDERLDHLTSGVLYSVPSELFLDAGLRPGCATTPAYRCDHAGAVLIRLVDIRGPQIGPGRRGYDPERLRSVVAAIATGVSLPPVPVFRESSGVPAVLLDGAHRFAVSIAYGYVEIPCELVARDMAELGYCYPSGQL